MQLIFTSSFGHELYTLLQNWLFPCEWSKRWLYFFSQIGNHNMKATLISNEYSVKYVIHVSANNNSVLYNLPNYTVALLDLEKASNNPNKILPINYFCLHFLNLDSLEWTDFKILSTSNFWIVTMFSCICSTYNWYTSTGACHCETVS